MVYEVLLAGKRCRVDISTGPGKWLIRLNGQERPLDISHPSPGLLSVLYQGRCYEIRRETAPDGNEQVLVGSQRFSVEVNDPRALRSHKRAGAAGQGLKKITAPMPGKIVRVLTLAGAEVELGQGVVVIEAMKMQNELKSPKAGRVQKITAMPGDAVNAGDVLAIIE